MPNQIEIPEEGLYVSSNPSGERFIVDEVNVVEDDEDEESEATFFLVSVVHEGDEDDMSAFGYEFDPDEWQRFVKQHSLVYKG
ncbi:hypothetical protein [Serratia liquefaciens]|uniref:hypothetical protein n=1 Tax=Serratia liquefaciens TaxID=614 RepID=UPI00095EFC05|nr:hypothetical protein [Serratia liquefaciens]OKP25636.1 hypothetical protein BSQ35_03990 [Serratia liquefaciens]